METRQLPARLVLSSILLLLGAAICANSTAAQPQKVRGPKVVEATRFILTDENGKPRGALAMSKFGPSIVLNDQDGRTRLQLTVRDDGSGPEVALFDPSGDRRSALRLNADQSPTLLMLDAKEQPRAMLGSEGIALLAKK